MNKSFKTFVFFDIETTGLPHLEFNKTKIIELALIASSKVELLANSDGKVPRVLHKLTICLNPRKMIQPDSSKITGLDNYNLENEKTFTARTGELIKAFFDQLQAPICLVAHNGFRFDYPILRKQLDDVGVPIDNMFCVDSLEIFRDIADSDMINECPEHPEILQPTVDNQFDEGNTSSGDFEVLLNSDIHKQQRLNEKTPSSRRVKAEQSQIRLQQIQKLSGARIGSKSKRVLFPSNEKGDGRIISSSAKKRLSFNLVDIYTRLHGIEPAVAHNAEEDTINLMKCFLAVKEQFIERAEKSAQEFTAITPLGMK